MQRIEKPFGIAAKNRLHSGSVQLLSTNEVFAEVKKLMAIVKCSYLYCNLFKRFQKIFEQQLYTIMTLCFRKSLFEEAGKYFDKETGVLEAPMIIRVADQVLAH